MIAYSLVPHRFEDGRHLAIEEGLRRSGYKVVNDAPSVIEPEDVLATWNSYGRNWELSRQFAKRDARHIVFEEAYLRNIKGERYFAAALWGHNGSGEWFPAGPSRWNSWHIEVSPWQTGGSHILICGQRGFGYNEMAMPDRWPDDVYYRLRQATDRQLWFRAHPKRQRREPTVKYDRILDFNEPLSAHLDGAWAVVTWSSNVATDALLCGIPAFFEAPHIVTEPATERGLQYLETPSRRGRELAFSRLAWAQWSMSEIRNGHCFEHLLQEQ